MSITTLTAKLPEVQEVKKRMASLGLPVTEIEREVSFALQIINNSADLQKCGKGSLLAAIINAANIGLTLNPAAKEACLIARWNSKQKSLEAHFEPMYGGLIALACREGVVTSMMAQAVYEGDDFKAQLHDNKTPIIHTIDGFDIDRSDDTKIRGFYAIATFADGNRQAELMSSQQVNEIRDGSDAWKAYTAGKIKSTPWLTSYAEMGRKTIIKRLTKYLNKKGGAAYSKLAEAIEIDNQGYGAAFWQLSKIDALLTTANISPEEGRNIYREYQEYTYQQAADCIAYLEENQIPNDFRHDGRMNQTDARRAVADAVENDRT